MAKRRAGWLIWLLAVGCLYFFENNAGTRAVLTASLVVPAISILCALWTAQRAAITVEAPARLEAGETGRLHVRMRGDVAWFCAVTARLEAANALTGEKSSREIRMDGTEVSEPLESAECGCLCSRVVSAEARDWFGLAAFPLRRAAEAETLVFPRLFSVALSPRDPGALESTGQTRFGPGEPDGGAREFRPGDARRGIHWKLSRKTGRLLSRETSRPEAAKWALLLETSIPGEICPALAREAEALLSVSRALLSEETEHMVFWFDGKERRLRRASVASGADHEAVAEELLRASAVPGGERIAALFAGESSEALPGRIVLFSARADTDAVSLAGCSAVTLVLPEWETAAVRAVSIGELREGVEL